MSGGSERFLAAADALGLAPDVHRFPEGTKTAQDAARAIGCDVAQIVKSLVFVADDRPVLALTSGANRVDTGKLAALAGAGACRRASADEVRDATGFAIGGTPPFGHPAPLAAFVDRDLLRFDEVWAAAGSPDAVFPLPPTRLVELAGAVEADLAEGPGG
ncbi:MAG TPA: YbaK/EbsC family protein [Actinomycetota bacterium]|nr:YbaK/EbsC family protein [Actinomycetota bacterium]